MDTSQIKRRKSLNESRGEGDSIKYSPKKQNPNITSTESRLNTNTNTTSKMSKQAQNKLARENLLIYKDPLKTLYYFLLSVIDLIKDYSSKLFFSQTGRKILISTIILVSSYYFSHKIPVPLLQDNIDSVEHTVKVCGYWIFLGILSSVGLGTGLHTFLLYLGPFIAKCTLAAYECQTTNFTGDSFNPNFKCPKEGETGYGTMAITLFTIMSKVRLESFMWGAGTAIGELPPYFMARAARLAGLKEKREEIQGEKEEADESDDEDEFKKELQEALEEADTTTLLGKGKAFMHNLVNQAGFFGILLAASIPNPLFDLAGITCGHFLIPFWTFFGATLIGKAVVKMHIQMVFIIFLFSKDKVTWLISLLDNYPTVQSPFKEFMDKQKDKLFHGQVDESADSGILKNCMELFVLSMVLYFVVSIVNSMAQGQLKKVQKEEEKRGK